MFVDYKDYEVFNENQIPKNNLDGSDCYVVYILTYKGKPIVVGHGKEDRARVIFDSVNKKPTKSHIKSLLVRIYHIYGSSNHDDFRRYIVPQKNKSDAKELEAYLHKKFGGNSTEIPNDLKESLFKDMENDEVSKMILQMALISSYSGCSDLDKWKRKGIISAKQWESISNRLKLN
jgi:hypothetical protein